MYLPTRDIVGCKVKEVDEEDAGIVHDIFFDSHGWQVRYVVVDTGSWIPGLTGRKVLVPCSCIEGKDWQYRTLSMQLTKTMVETSKEIRNDPPVSRQLADYTYVAFQPIRQAEPVGTMSAAPSPTAANAPETDASGRPLLRSAKEVRGYHVKAADGEIGHIEDFVIDDSEWKIGFLEVDTRDWLPGRHVLLAPSQVSTIEWSDRSVYVQPPKDVIQEAPEYDRSAGITTQLQHKTQQHYANHGFVDSVS